MAFCTEEEPRFISRSSSKTLIALMCRLTVWSEKKKRAVSAFEWYRLILILLDGKTSDRLVIISRKCLVCNCGWLIVWLSLWSNVQNDNILRPDSFASSNLFVKYNFRLNEYVELIRYLCDYQYNFLNYAWGISGSTYVSNVRKCINIFLHIVVHYTYYYSETLQSEYKRTGHVKMQQQQ